MGDSRSILVETIPYHVDVPGALFEYLFNKKLISEDAKIMNMPALAPVGQPSLFSVLVESCSLYFIIRLKEETRGGEIIELCSILNSLSPPNIVTLAWMERVFLFKKSEIVLSTMFQILLDNQSVSLREFIDEDDLCKQIGNLIKLATPY